MPEIHDIAIIGGGIAGASLAYFLDGRRSVVLLEQEQAFGYHSTGRSAAEFTRRFHSEIAGQLTSASTDFMMSPPDGFAETALLRLRGNLVIADHEKAAQLHSTCAAELAAAPKGASPVQPLTKEEALGKVPFLDPDWLGAAFYDPDCWDVEVETLLQGFMKGARKQDGQTLREARVTAARRDRDHWVLETCAGDIRARTVVNAAGGWAAEIAALFGLPNYGLQPLRRTAISVNTPGHDLTYLPEVTELEDSFYFKPDAGQLMVSPADETPVTPHDAWPEELDIAFAAHYLAECTTLEISHVAHSWAGLRTFAPDRAPLIGYDSAAEGVFWLAGLGGFGIQTSPAVGQLAAALLTQSPLPCAISGSAFKSEQVSPDRFRQLA